MKNPLFDNLNAYKRKYYLNLLLKGSLIMLALVSAIYFIVNFLEYFGRFSTPIRAVLFFSFMMVAVFSTMYWVVFPLTKLLKLSKQISDEDAASQIGTFFPNIQDKLLNTLQLQKTHSHSELLMASISQKSQEISIFSFPDAIDLRENRKYLRYILPILLFILLILVFGDKSFFSESSKRIINFNESFADKAPFQFSLQNKSLEAFKNEDFRIELRLEGNPLPAEAYFISENGRIKMQKDEKKGVFFHLFSKIQKPEKFSFDAAGYRSNGYKISLRERPNLLNFSAVLNYPAYLNKPSENLKNIGNLVVPQGTQIQWQLNTNSADSLTLHFEGEKGPKTAEKQSDRGFLFQKVVMTSQNYQIKLKNQFAENKEEINYYVNVIADQYPKITMETAQDTALYNSISVGGNVADDYGVSQVQFYYRVISEGKASEYKGIPVPVQVGKTAQNFYYDLDITSLTLKPGDKIEYFGQVWDNDGVNGSKSSKTVAYQFKIPDEQELKKELSKSSQNAENQIDKTIQKAKDLQKDLEDLENKLKNKRNLEYNDKKQIEEILKKKDDLQKDIEKMKELNQLSNDKQNRFGEQSEQMQEKIKQLEKLMSNVLDEDTKKLYEELEKLLNKQRTDPNVLELLEKLQNKEEVTQKELDRAMEMFKQMQYDQKAEKTTKELEKLAEEQKQLAEQTEKSDKKDEQKQQDLKDKQDELNKKFDDLKKELDDLDKLNKEMQEPNPEINTDKEEQEIDKEQKEGSENIQKKENKKASENQKKASKKMKEIAEKMQQMQEQEEMESLDENLDNLRDIMENLLTLSFSQEQLMKDFRGVNLSDPRFIDLAQKQIKLQDDAQIIEDSLTALAKRVPQIESFVTREVAEMRQYMKESSKAIKERKISQTGSKQQFAMTSMNNLALMLNDVLSDMQQQQKEQKEGKKSGKKKGKKKGSSNPSDLQKELSKQIEDLKKSGKTGKQLSEELAKMAAQQEAIRKMLQEMKEKGAKDKDGKGLGEQLNELMKQMEETEKDLVNKRIEDQTIKRQKEIETRLLEVEKSMRERDLDDQRKGETAKDKTKTVPKNLEPYLKSKEKGVELLKTVPPALSPYYKKEVDKYFDKIQK